MPTEPEPQPLTDAEIREWMKNAVGANDTNWYISRDRTLALGTALLGAREQLERAEERAARLSFRLIETTLRAEAAEAKYAELAQRLAAHEQECAAWLQTGPCDCILALPNPGAGLLAELEQDRKLEAIIREMPQNE